VSEGDKDEPVSDIVAVPVSDVAESPVTELDLEDLERVGVSVVCACMVQVVAGIPSLPGGLLEGSS
jgi:hypothetical protein